MRGLIGVNSAQEAANLLAETPPYVVPADSLPLRFLHSQPPPGPLENLHPSLFPIVATNQALPPAAAAVATSVAVATIGVPSTAAVVESHDVDNWNEEYDGRRWRW